jgi:hypothetical protein
MGVMPGGKVNPLPPAAPNGAGVGAAHASNGPAAQPSTKQVAATNGQGSEGEGAQGKR